MSIESFCKFTFIKKIGNTRYTNKNNINERTQYKRKAVNEKHSFSSFPTVEWSHLSFLNCINKRSEEHYKS